jgi:hypothetical protein
VSRKHHYVKILPEYYIAIEQGIKTFEIRFNDRNYKVGDILHLQEFCGGKYTSRELTKEICYMIDNPDYCKEGFVVLGIKDIQGGRSDGNILCGAMCLSCDIDFDEVMSDENLCL